MVRMPMEGIVIRAPTDEILAVGRKGKSRAASQQSEKEIKIVKMLHRMQIKQHTQSPEVSEQSLCPFMDASSSGVLTHAEAASPNFQTD